MPQEPAAPPREKRPTVVIAMGGHAFMREGESGTHEEHHRNARLIATQLMTLVERGYNVVITHGNGPQVGNLLLRNELCRPSLPEVPLDVLVAQTEGSLGYYLQQAMLNELRARDIQRFVVTVVTQVLVDPHDKAFEHPSKPVGPFLKREEAEARRDELGWIIGEDAPRGWRRLVPSPRPLRVVQRDMIRDAAERGHVVIAAGGGGVPIREDEHGDWTGVEAVVDKDLTSSVLATDVDAELLVILTAVDRTYLNYGTPTQQGLDAVTLAEGCRYLEEGHFPKGSMGPKVEAVIGFLKRGGRRGLVTNPENLADALDGAAGTHFVGRI